MTTRPGGRSASAAPRSSKRWPAPALDPHHAGDHRSATAQRWFDEFEGAGLDGVIAKPLTITYRPDTRSCSRSSTSGPPTAWSQGTGCTSPARTRSARYCSACTRTTAPSPRSASSAPSRWPNGGNCSPSCSRSSPPSMATRGTGQPTKPANPPPQKPRLPLERRQGPVVRAAATRTGRRGPLRPHGRRTVPPHRTVQPLAPRPRPRSCTYAQLEQPLTFRLSEIVPGLAQAPESLIQRPRRPASYTGKVRSVMRR